MSMSALLYGIRDRLWTTLKLETATCEVMPDGRPPPSMAGEWFYAVHEGDWDTGGRKSDYDLHEVYSACVTITRRIAFAPNDRHGNVIYEAKTGLDAQVRKVMTSVHHNHLLRLGANEILAAEYGSVPDALVTPLFWKRCGRLEEKGPDWFLSDDGSQTGYQAAYAGIVRQVFFGEAERVQTITGMV